MIHIESAHEFLVREEGGLTFFIAFLCDNILGKFEFWKNMF